MTRRRYTKLPLPLKLNMSFDPSTQTAEAALNPRESSAQVGDRHSCLSFAVRKKAWTGKSACPPRFARLIAVRVILQGSLDHFPAAELLPLLVSHKHGGTLDLLSDADGKRTRVFLRGGRVDWTEASDGTACEEAIL